MRAPTSLPAARQKRPHLAVGRMAVVEDGQMMPASRTPTSLTCPLPAPRPVERVHRVVGILAEPSEALFQRSLDFGAGPGAVADQGFERFLRRCARYWAIAPRHYPRGVFKFRGIEEAQAARTHIAKDAQR